MNTESEKAVRLIMDYGFADSVVGTDIVSEWCS